MTKTATVLKTIMLKFKLNEEFDDTTPDGRQVRKQTKFLTGVFLACFKVAILQGENPGNF